MEADCLLTNTAGGILTLTLNRPAALNSLDQPLRQRLLAALDSAAADSSVIAIVLTGAGRGFCAGADLKEATNGGDMADSQATADRVRRLMETEFNPIIAKIAAMPKPTIAAVNGMAAGGGVGLALSCDIVLCSEGARFYQPFVPALGLVPDMGCTWFVPAAAGRARALAWALTGDVITAATALEWGLVWKVVENCALKSFAETLALKLGQLSPETVIAARQALAHASHASLTEQLHHEMETQHRLATSLTYRKGVMRFSGKEP